MSARVATWSSRIGATAIVVATLDLAWRLLDLHASRSVAVVVVVPLASVAAVRLWRFGSHLDDAGVRVANLLREHRFRWDEVQAFRFDLRIGAVGVRLRLPAQRAETAASDGTGAWGMVSGGSARWTIGPIATAK